MKVNTNKPTYYKRVNIWKDISLNDWNDWRWQLKNVVTSLKQLEGIVPLTKREKQGVAKAIKASKFQVTPYYLSLIDRDNSECPIKLQCIPREEELQKGVADIYDPLAEDADSPVPRLVHRYPDRVLFLASEICSTYCRFCTRRRTVLKKTRAQLSKEHDKAIEYIKRHKEVRDVIVSGGDALMLDMGQLESIVSRLKKIRHVEIVRIASRTPCVFPQRVTREFVNMLKRYQPIYFMTHFNHPYELTPAAVGACGKIADAGMPVLNQTVLLRKINSSTYVMRKLVHELLKARVKPYYIYQCDLSVGIEHFRTPIGKGLKIMERLRGHTSGLALPTLVVDAPGGGGKVPIMPNYLLTHTDERVVIRNYRGMMSSYTDPVERDCTCSTEKDIKKTCVRPTERNKAYFDLVQGKRFKLDPKV